MKSIKSQKQEEGMKTPNPPDHIYLQWNGDADPDEPGAPYEPEVTWSRERIFDGDIEYIRADTITSAAERKDDDEA